MDELPRNGPRLMPSLLLLLLLLRLRLRLRLPLPLLFLLLLLLLLLLKPKSNIADETDCDISHIFTAQHTHVTAINAQSTD